MRTHKGDLFGLTVYAHGIVYDDPKKDFVGPPDPCKMPGTPTGEVGNSKDWIQHMDIINGVRAGGYKIAEANMRQCYSKATVYDGQRTKINYDEKWREAAMVFNGYWGINAFGVDFGSPPEDEK